MQLERELEPTLLAGQLEQAQAMRDSFAFLASKSAIRRLGRAPLGQQVRRLRAEAKAALAQSARIGVRTLGRVRRSARRLGAGAEALSLLRRAQVAAGQGNSAVLGGLAPIPQAPVRTIGPSPVPSPAPPQAPLPLPPSPPAPRGLAFTDWTSVSANVATGALHGTAVALAGSHVWPPPVSELNGANFFGDPALFAPPLATSDHIQISGYPGYTYTLTFATPILDPILHLASVASSLQFPAGTQITRVSGSPNFTVSGSTVSGDLENNAGGTIRLAGPISSLTFSATTLYDPPIEDGVVLQIGAP